jgi:hypothetical protein
MNIKILSLFILILFFSEPSIIGYTAINFQSKNINETSLEFKKGKEFSSFSLYSFTENKGQINNSDVEFYNQEGDVWFSNDGVYFKIREEIETRRKKSDDMDITHYYLKDKYSKIEPKEYRHVILKKDFVGANNVTPIGQKYLGWNSNYFHGNDSSRWVTEVPNYEEVYFKNLYNGIDLVYYNNKYGLKYDFIIHPGADYNQIRIRYTGIEGLEKDNNENLIIKTELYNLIDNKPYLYQIDNGEHKTVKGKYIIFNNYEYGFDITQNYNMNCILVVDPLIEYSTYIGGSTNNIGRKIAVDKNGNTYITGDTTSIDFPTTIGAYNTTLGGGPYDAFIFKLNHNSSKLMYSTFLGGTKSDAGKGIRVDSIGNVIVTGYTASSDFPNTTGAYDTSQNGDIDCFVAKLNPNGSSLIYSTYIGGSNSDYCRDLAIDSLGNAYVTGQTKSTNFPIVNGYDTSHNGNNDLFIFKLNQTGSSINYSTFMGGGGWDAGYKIDVDKYGNAYVAGLTFSSNFPTTSGAYDTSFNGDQDIIVLKLNHNGSKLNYSTFVGGSLLDHGYGITVDDLGEAIVIGITGSSNFPSTLGAYSSKLNGTSDAVVFRLNKTGASLNFSTFIGGSYWDTGHTIDIDSVGNLHISGTTGSTDFPISSDAYYNYNNDTEGFYVNLSSNGSIIQYSTYVGGIDVDAPYDIEIDDNDNIYITGWTYSSDFPITPGVFNSSFVFGHIFIMKFSYKAGMKITSLSVLENNKPISVIYSQKCPYNFQIRIINTVNLSDLRSVNLTLLSKGGDFHLLWNATTKQFLKLNDPNHYIILEKTSSVYNYSNCWWTINFNVTFNWTYPDEVFQNVRIYALSKILPPVWYNMSKVFRVENDLTFNGTLIVKTKFNRSLIDGDFVKGGETLNFSGLTIVYEGTTNIYPIINSINVTIWDELNNIWKDSPKTGEQFNIEIQAPLISKINSYEYTINLSGILSENDATNVSFNIKIDNENITFINAFPDNDKWQTNSNVLCKITCIDYPNGAKILGKSLEYRFSTDNGSNWSNWINLGISKNDTIINVSRNIFFPDGVNNLIQWKGNDVVENGPNISNTNRILVDTSIIKFENNTPVVNKIFNYLKVNCSINITDNISGINATSIEYSIKLHGSTSWSNWQNLGLQENRNKIHVKEVIQFNEGNENYIRWRAKDIAGNGPTLSDEFQIVIDKTNVIFKDPKPSSNKWNNDSTVTCNISCIDIGSALVDGNSISYSISLNNGSIWNEWINANIDLKTKMINASVMVSFPDGIDNLIRWRALDTAGNGPSISPYYRIFVDSEDIFFSNGFPLKEDEFDRNEVQIGITVEDEISGVNASSIMYALSFDDGVSWEDWIKVKSLKNGPKIDVKLNLTFPNGTMNRIKWCASDLAGNGPKESDIYHIKINTWKPPEPPIIIPKVNLVYPLNGSIHNTSNVEFKWILVDPNLNDVKYDIILDTIYPPIEIRKQNISTNTFIIDDLENGKTYYWKIIPKISDNNGICLSGIWSFIVDFDVPIPKVKLVSPENNTSINTTRILFKWSLSYFGKENITFQIHIWNFDKSSYIIEDISFNQYEMDINSEFGKEYYWKVIPKTGKIIGIESETWLFSLRFEEEIPNFGINLQITPNIFNLKPNENTTVKIIIKNIGEIKDNISLKIKTLNETEISLEIINQNILELNPGEEKEFFILIYVPINTPKGKVLFKVIARSETAEKIYGLEVGQNKTIIIEVIEISDKDDIRNPKDDNNLIYFIIGIIIIIIILIVILILLKKKKTKKIDAKEIEKEKSEMKSNLEKIPEEKLPIPQPEQQNFCSNCGLKMNFFQQNKKYYCYYCKKYE